MSDRIEVRALSKIFTSAKGAQKTALAGVEMVVGPSTFVSIVGPSGCGKTTLLMMVAGLESHEDGEILINGEQVRGPKDEVGIVYQRPVLLPWKTTLENTLLPVSIKGLKMDEYRPQAERLLKEIGLGDFLRHYPTELSGGMAQRNALARGLILKPGLLLMDEPFAALDALTREQMSMLLAGVWEQYRTTVLFVTHSIQEAILLSDRVLVMSAAPGSIVADIAIDLPRPRRFEQVETPEYVKLASRIRSHLAPAGTPTGGKVE